MTDKPPRLDVVLNPNLNDVQKMLVLENNMSILQSRIIENDSTLERHHKLLIEGNGELPMLERLRNLEQFIGVLKFWLRTVAIAIVLQTITFGIASMVYFIRLLPLLEKLTNP
jgi:hypothetical protein